MTDTGRTTVPAPAAIHRGFGRGAEYTVHVDGTNVYATARTARTAREQAGAELVAKAVRNTAPPAGVLDGDGSLWLLLPDPDGHSTYRIPPDAPARPCGIGSGSPSEVADSIARNHQGARRVF